MAGALPLYTSIASELELIGKVGGGSLTVWIVAGRGALELTQGLTMETAGPSTTPLRGFAQDDNVWVCQ